MDKNRILLKSIIKSILLTEATIDVWKNKNTNLTNEQLTQAEKYFSDLTGKYNALVHPTAKDLTKLSFEQLETFYKSVDLAKNKNLKASYVQWLTKQLKQKPELSFEQISEDYIPPLLSLQKNKEKFDPSFLENLQSIEELNKALNQKVSSEEMAVSDDQYGKLAEQDGWVLYMPHTTEASCEIGKTGGRRDTVWCTSRPDASNMFLQYVGDPDKSIILFYVVKKGINAEKDPYAKMSVGFVDDKPLFNQGSGGVSVNANNDNLKEEKFKEVLGADLANKFLSIMKQKSASLQGEHPAKEEFRKLVQNPTAFQAKLNSFADDENGRQLRKNFIESAFKYNPSPEVLLPLAKDKDVYVRGRVARNPNTPREVLLVLAKDKDKNVRRYVASNPNTPREVLLVLAEDKDVYVRGSIANNPKAPPEALLVLAKDTDEYVRSSVAENPSTPREVLLVLAEDKDVYVRGGVARNPNTPREVLLVLAKDKDVYVRGGVARNPNTPKEALLDLAKDKSKDVRSSVAKNPNTPREALLVLAKDTVKEISTAAQKTLAKLVTENLVLAKVFHKLLKYQ